MRDYTVHSMEFIASYQSATSWNFSDFQHLSHHCFTFDNSAVDSIIDANRLTPRCRHLDIPIAFLHQEKGKSFEQFLIRTHQMLADFGTKPLATLLHKRYKYWVTGAAFLPVKDTEHYNLLQMQFYECSFVDIIAALKRASDE